MKKLLLIYFLLLTISHAWAFDMKRYLSNTISYTNEEFIRTFPYVDYLRSVEFTDFKTIQYHRYLIFLKRNNNDNIGDRFVYSLAENFIKYYPINSSDLNTKINIAEKYLKAGPTKNTNSNELFKITGYYLLGQIARTIEKDIENKKINVNDFNKTIARLNKNNVNISIKVSSVEKALKKVKSGDYKYLGNRVVLKLKELIYPLSIKLKIDNSVLFNILMIVLFLMLIVSKISRRLSPLLFILVLLASFLSKGEKNISLTSPVISPDPNIFLSPLKTPRNGIEIYKLVDKKNKIIGQSIWMDRTNIKANYIAKGNVYNKYQDLMHHKKVVLACAGGFTNQKGYPLGLTIDKGQIANAVLRHDRDGLILVSKKGGIRILNLKRDRFNLPGLKKPIKNPLNSLLAYSDLLNWATLYKQTIFQVQLLAYSDKLLINSSKAPNQIRERRILALFSDKYSGKVYHAIFNIESPSNLAIITEEIFAIISSRNKKVEAILNLDVGSYNILNVFDGNGNIINNIQGPVSIKTSTNLLVYTRK